MTKIQEYSDKKSRELAVDATLCDTIEELNKYDKKIKPICRNLTRDDKKWLNGIIKRRRKEIEEGKI